jgi:hypothetical protein
MIKDLKGVLTFAAFRSEPDDPAASWRNRFSHQSTALVNLGRNMVSYVTFDRRGGIKPGSLLRGEPKELLAEVGPLIAEGTDEGWCILSLNTRYVISLEHNLPRKQGSEETIKTDPRSVLHGRYERSKRYAVTHNPESNSSLLLAYEEENVRKIEGMLKEQGLKLGRLCCGAYVLLRHALAKTNVTKGTEKPFSGLYIACCAGSVCMLLQEKDNWLELRSRPDVYDESDLQPLLDLLAPYHDRLDAETELVLAADDLVPGLPDRLAEIFPGRPLQNLCRPNLLAELVFQY